MCHSTSPYGNMAKVHFCDTCDTLFPYFVEKGKFKEKNIYKGKYCARAHVYARGIASQSEPRV